MELDQGNSRLKWRLLSSSAEATVQEGAVLGHGADALRCVEQALPPAISAAVQRVRLSCVGGTARTQQLLQACRETWRPEPEVAHTRTLWAGLHCAYECAEDLGSDRWLAMLAARHLQRGNLCVVDVGSALTVDIVTADGRHLGGYIAAGQRTLFKALGAGVPELQTQPPPTPPTDAAPGTSTEAGIAAGVLGAMVGLVHHALLTATC